MCLLTRESAPSFPTLPRISLTAVPLLREQVGGIVRAESKEHEVS